MLKKESLISLTKIFVIAIIVLLNDLFSFSQIVVGSTIVLISGFEIYKLLRNNKIISPLTFSKLFLLTFGLNYMQLSTSIHSMSLITEMVIIFCMLIWDFINYVNEVEDTKKFTIENNFNMHNLKLFSIFFIIIGSLFMTYEWIKFGGIPVLAENLETSRFNISAGSVFHISAISLKISVIYLGIYIILRYSKNKKIDLLSLVFFLIGFLFLFGLGSRMELLFPLVILFMYLFEKKKIKKATFIKILIPLFLVIAIYPIIRNYSNYGREYLNDIRRISKYKNLYLMTPLYESLSYNLEVFRLDTEIFPNIYNFGYGKFGILSNIPFVDLGESLTVVQNMALQNGFYAGLASTYLGTLYADFGYLGCLLFTLIFAMAIKKIYNNYLKQKTTSSAILYFYVLFHVILFFYHYTLNIVFFAYLFFVLLLNRLCKERKF